MHRCVHPLLLPASAAVWVGCTPDAPKPVLTGVSPSWGYRGGDTAIVVEGRRFFPLVEARGSRDVRVEDSFSLMLDTLPPTMLGEVRRIDDQQLAATVPAGLDPGRYDLEVTGPDGYTDRLVDAFTVTDTEAAVIALAAPQIRSDVREDALVELQLRDPSGRDVPAGIEVEVSAVPLDGDGSAIVFQSGLVDQVALAPGIIRGRLDSGGGADLYFTSTIVDDVAIEVRGLGLNNHLYTVGPQIRFEPATIADVRFVFDDSEPIRAGEPFSVSAQLLDADGNPTRGELLVATVQETCGLGSDPYLEVWTIPDRVVMSDVVLSGATVPGGCEENRLQLVGVLNGEAFVVESEPLEVEAGEVIGYRVVPTLPEVTAGVEPQTLLVRAEDSWGNPVPTHTGLLSLTDNLGGLSADSGAGSGTCSAFFDGQAVCAAVLERAGSAVEITASTADGIWGTSSEFSVLAGAAASLEVAVELESVVAGEQLLVRTQPRDDFGNPADLAPLGGASAVQLADSTGTLACSGRFDGPELGLLFSLCAVTQADEAVVVEASVPSAGLLASADPIEVTNAEVADVQIQLDSSSLRAGESLAFTLQAQDAFGNPYVEQTTSTILLADQGLELAPSAVSLDAMGEGSGAVTLVRATGSNRLTAEVFGVIMGVSDAFVVTPGPQSGYTLELGSTWVELGEPTSAQVFAVDAWGNVATTVDASVDVESAQDAGDSVIEVEVVGGTGAVEFLWDTIALQDFLTVTDGSFSGTSEPVDAVSFDCAAGPVAALSVSDTDQLRLCLVGGNTSPVDLSASDSEEGASPLLAFHGSDGDGTTTRRSVDTWSSRWRTEGGRQPSVVVVDELGCASEDEVTVWVGAADGEPVGAVEVLIDETLLTAGSSTAGTTRVDLAAWDCAGDPSRRGTLSLRAELGVIQSGSTAVTATGSGLQLALDSNGQASVDWTVAGADSGGSPRVHAGVPSGAAHGSGAAFVTGDARRPFFVDLSPVGPTVDSWSTLVLKASEPLYDSSVTSDAIELLDPDGDELALSSVSLSADGSVITLNPEVPVDGSLGIYELTVAQTVRDDGGGNRIDGGWSGGASPLTVQLGGVTNDAPDILSCTASLTRFRPDGDDGTGVDADSVEVMVTADGLPAIWWMEVTDADGEVVHWQPTAGSGASATLAWDGRDVGGRVQPAGRYVVELSGRDANFAEGSVCSVDVEVEHLIAAPGDR